MKEPTSLDALRRRLAACVDRVAGDDSYEGKRRLAHQRWQDEWFRLAVGRGKRWLDDRAAAAARQFTDGIPEVDRVSPRLIACSSPEDYAIHRYLSAMSAFPTRDRPGRRMKLLLVDDGTPGSPIMAIATLSSAISVLRVRDDWIGWPRCKRDHRVWERLAYVMDLSTCIGVPPYGALTSAKLLAHLVVSDACLDLYRRRYAGRPTSRLGRVIDVFALIVATGAFKTKTPTYRGIDVEGRRVFQLIGKTRGFSSAHVPDALYRELAEHLASGAAQETAIRKRGPHVRFNNLRVFARRLGLPEEAVLRPGQRRSVYVAEAAMNARAFLRGEADGLVLAPPSAERIIQVWRQRWLQPRGRRAMARRLPTPQVEEPGGAADEGQEKHPLGELTTRRLTPKSQEPTPMYARVDPFATLDLDELLQALRRSWTATTSNSPALWRPDKPAVGQCAVTALIIQDVFGGEILRGKGPDGSHYWNRLPSGKEIDLTADQFDTLPAFSAVEVRSRSYILSFPETCDRYAALRKRVADRPENLPA